MNDNFALPPGLEALWKETLGSPGVCVAVLDGPVDTSHPCFSGAKLTSSVSLVSDAVSESPALTHGTHVASIIFGQHHSAVRGIAPGCRGVVAPIYASGSARLTATQLDLARAINKAVELGANVINISGGELSESGVAESLLTQAIQRCSEQGILIVAAAGNDGCSCLHVPAAVPSVLAVGAMDSQGNPMDFSNWGTAYQEQGILAYGENILGAVPGGGVTQKSGTSFATPIIAGVVALFLSILLRRGDKPDAQKIRKLILETADPCDSNVVSDCRRLLAGRLNLKSAFARLDGAKAGPGKTANIHFSGHDALPRGPARATRPAIRESAVNVTRHSTGGRYGETAGNGTHQLLNEEKLMFEENQLTPSEVSADLNCQAGVGEVAAENVMALEYAAALNEPATAPVLSGAGVVPSTVEAAECACSNSGGNSNGRSKNLVYVLGQIGYDFGTESRRDSFLQQSDRNVQDTSQMLEYLRESPAAAASMIWTLSLDTTVIYAVAPVGPYANVAYDRLGEFLQAQMNEGVERVSVPGILVGSVTLLNGQQVPAIIPDVRGMYSWSTQELVKTVTGDELQPAEVEGIQNFLERVYYEVRNLGSTPQERAMNYAATNAFQLKTVYGDAIKADLKLDHIGFERSPICRPGSDCWDVKLVFFNPAKRLEQARRVYRFTVDVSDVIPVTVGKVRHWDIY